MNGIQKIEISPKTILFTISVILIIWLLIQLKELVILVFVAFSISAMVSPIVDYLHEKNFPKPLSIFLIYVLFFTGLGILIFLMYKPFASQLEDFLAVLPGLFVNIVNEIGNRFPAIKEQLNWDEVVNNIENSFWEGTQVSDIPGQVFTGVGKAFGIVGSFFNVLINIISTIVLSVYFIHIKEPSKQRVLQVIPKKYKKRVFDYINTVEHQLGAWLRAQLFLMFLIGSLSWIGLEIVGLKFALPMGVISGFLEVIPNVGPTISLILALVIGIGSGAAVWKIIFIAIWFIAIQQFENYVIVPQLIRKVVGISPVLTLIALLGASKIFGLWGTLLAVPAVAILQISFRFYLKYKKPED